MSVLIDGEEMLPAGFKCVGMDTTMSEVLSVLIRSSQSSVVLTGPKGVGRSTLCLGLQAAKDAGRFDLAAKRFFWLDSDALFSDDKRVSDEWATVVNVLDRTDGSVLVIENAADFINSAKAEGHDHFINSLLRMVRDGKTQVIAEVADDSFDVLIKAHSGVTELFTVVDVHEPEPEALSLIAHQAALGLASFHSISIEEDAVAAAIELTSKYRDASRAQPSRTITLLDRSIASLRLSAHQRVSKATLAVVSLASSELREAEEAVIAAEAQVKDERAKVENSKASSSKVRDFKRMLTGDLTSEAGKSAVRLLEAVSQKRNDAAKKLASLSANINASIKLRRQDVITEFSAITGIPATKLTEDDREKLRSLEGRILERIFGQDRAVKHVVDMVKTSRIGTRSGGRPKGACMFMGPSGVGKTEMAKVLASELFGDEKALFRLDMSEYMEKHAVAKLIGAPPGYEGFEAGGILTNGIRKRPVCVLLLDEIEKAHPDVFNVFLQILGDGRLTDNVGRVVSFQDVYVICTTNIGQAHYLDPKVSEKVAHERTMKDLDSTYRPEFLNRFGGRKDIIHFRALPVEVIERIVERELHEISKVYWSEGIVLEVDKTGVKKFCAVNYDPRTGARGLPGHLRSTLEPTIADVALAKKDGEEVVLKVTYDADAKNLVARKK